MFKKTDADFIDPEREKLLSLGTSLNRPVVAAGPGMPNQPAQAFVMVYRGTKDNDIQTYAGLFFIESQKKQLFVMEKGVAQGLEECVTVAEAFVGEMGFMMNSHRILDLTPEERATLIRTNPFFYNTIEAFSKGEEKMKPVTDEVSVDIHQAFLESYVKLISML